MLRKKGTEVNITFHTRLEYLPLAALNRFIDQRVLGDEEIGGFRQRFAEVLELFDGEAFVLDGGEEVAVLQVVFDGFDGFFLPGSADGGADCGAVPAEGGGEVGTGLGKKG